METCVAERKEYDFKGLKALILSVFSDEDTNGNNGPEYLTREARKYFGFDPDDNEWYKDIPEDDLEKFTNDWYLFNILDEMAGKPEIDVVAKAFEIYAPTVLNYYDDMSWDYAENDKGQITALFFAGHVS